MSNLYIAQCELDLALTYALRRPDLARQCATRALFAALRAGNPEVTYQANTLLGLVSL